MRWSSIGIIDQSHGSVKFVHTPFVHLSPNNALNSRFGASYLLCPFWLSVADWRFSYESRHQFSFHFCVTALCRIRCLRWSPIIEHRTTWNQGLAPEITRPVCYLPYYRDNTRTTEFILLYNRNEPCRGGPWCNSSLRQHSFYLTLSPLRTKAKCKKQSAVRWCLVS